MAEPRNKCVICLREQPTDADWDRNGEIDDAQAAAEGFDDLCWEEGQDDCLGEAIELGRPTNYEGAMARVAELEALLKTS